MDLGKETDAEQTSRSRSHALTGVEQKRKGHISDNRGLVDEAGIAAQFRPQPGCLGPLTRNTRSTRAALSSQEALRQRAYQNSQTLCC